MVRRTSRWKFGGSSLDLAIFDLGLSQVLLRSNTGSKKEGEFVAYLGHVEQRQLRMQALGAFETFQIKLFL